jgi:hypothetical protein
VSASPLTSRRTSRSPQEGCIDVQVANVSPDQADGGAARRDRSARTTGALASRPPPRSAIRARRLHNCKPFAVASAPRKRSTNCERSPSTSSACVPALPRSTGMPRSPIKRRASMSTVSGSRSIRSLDPPRNSTFDFPSYLAGVRSSVRLSGFSTAMGARLGSSASSSASRPLSLAWTEL